MPNVKLTARCPVLFLWCVIGTLYMPKANHGVVLPSVEMSTMKEQTGPICFSTWILRAHEKINIVHSVLQYSKPFRAVVFI